jgi:hypothetical protein
MQELAVFSTRDGSVRVNASIDLHLFEPRYKLMVQELMQEAIRGNQRFLYSLDCPPRAGGTAYVCQITRWAISACTVM